MVFWWYVYLSLRRTTGVQPPSLLLLKLVLITDKGNARVLAVYSEQCHAVIKRQITMPWVLAPRWEGTS